MNGILVAIAGLILSARLGAGSPSAGQNAELDAIAACVIGGFIKVCIIKIAIFRWRFRTN